LRKKYAQADTRMTNDVSAFERLFPLVYDELRRIARRQLGRERAGHTLQPTALVHEAYLKLVEHPSPEWQGRAHFLGIAARAMRQILIDYARKHKAEKRGGAWERTTLGDTPVALDVGLEELLALDAALNRLDQMDSRMGKIVELSFFGGLTEKEIAEMLGLSERTVRREWVKARAWIHKELYPYHDRSERGDAG
jgi:RNA polymerase sigma factor (TIGR02999 family)